LQDRWNPILKDLKREDKWEAVLDFCSQEKGINQNVLNLIDELRSKGYKLGLLSNNSLEGGVEIRKKGIDKYFDTVLISAEIGLMKPQQEIFFLLAERLGVRPEELIFIDDTPRSLEGAEKVGFHPLVFTTYESLLKDLDTLEVI
jgi:putative hydrolase of the HAD superfamily